MNIGTKIIIPGQLPPAGTLFFRQFTNILEPLAPAVPLVACEFIPQIGEFRSRLIKILGVVFPTLPWCVGPLSSPIPRTSLPPESPVDDVPNDLNGPDIQENTSKICVFRAMIIHPFYFSVPDSRRV